VALVVAAGAAVLAGAFDEGTKQPLMLAALLGLSLLASLAKVEIAVLGSGATLTACHIIDLLALLIGGTDTAVLVAAWSAWTQCSFRNKTRNPLHQTLFSVRRWRSQWAPRPLVYVQLGGPANGATPHHQAVCGRGDGVLSHELRAHRRRGFAHCRRCVLTVWSDFFLSVWPSYLIGAGLSACPRPRHSGSGLLAGAAAGGVAGDPASQLSGLPGAHERRDYDDLTVSPTSDSPSTMSSGNWCGCAQRRQD
jgi:hypothetical protein